MKEASGEASMTVVTIIIIGLIVGLATPIVSSVMNSTSIKAECLNNGGCIIDGDCETPCPTGTTTTPVEGE